MAMTMQGELTLLVHRAAVRDVREAPEIRMVFVPDRQD
jgi:hypothetical protein